MDSKKLLLLAGVGYGLYNYWDKISTALGIHAASGSAVLTPGVVLDKSPSTSTSTVTGNGGATIPGLVDALTNYINQNPSFLQDGGQTFDAWNWLARTLGVFDNPKGIEDVFPSMDRGAIMSASQYYGGLHDKGLAGIVPSTMFNSYLATTGLVIPKITMEDFLSDSKI